MKCRDKVRYADHEQAVNASYGLAKADVSMRIYHCDKCNGWHFTSKETWGGSKQQKFNPKLKEEWDKLIKE